MIIILFSLSTRTSFGLLIGLKFVAKCKRISFTKFRFYTRHGVAFSQRRSFRSTDFLSTYIKCSWTVSKKFSWLVNFLMLVFLSWRVTYRDLGVDVLGIVLFLFALTLALTVTRAN
ncbi:hypothetical protein J3Q64DRAFT_1754786 [Phycomyces blakesleeanus]|uniref:Uncharacterized protein n=1 Tax=Phycomyces blakesleeanus TaxID=4837 RepID=A0ABR3AU22_PHYBL